MDVKGWLIVGETPGGTLAPTQPPLVFYGPPADASGYPQGTVATWVTPTVTVTLVCVRVPVAPGMD